MTRYSDPERQKLFIERLSAGKKGKLLGMNNPSKRPEVRAKISAKLKGRDAPWTIGDKNVAKRPEVKEKIRNNKNSAATRFTKGQTPYNKGETVETNPIVKTYTEKATIKRQTEQFKQMARNNVLNNYRLGKWHSDSPAEDEMERILIGFGFKKNVDYIHPFIITGKFVFDFFIIRQNLVIETDGREHRHDKERKAKDKVKEEYLRQNGFSLIRFRNEEILNHKEVVINILRSKLFSNI